MNGLCIICRAPQSEEEWAAYYDLRWRVLRQPWNQPPGSERDSFEDAAVHACVFGPDNQVLGVGRLHRLDENSLQIRYMAVEESHRGKGVGRCILTYLENEARRNNIMNIVLNARESSIPFYERCGYTVSGQAHVLFGEIPHAVMEKYLK